MIDQTSETWSDIARHCREGKEAALLTIVRAGCTDRDAQHQRGRYEAFDEIERLASGRRPAPDEPKGYQAGY